ncbi:MAG: hypothetical protein ACI8PZ_005378 [Myxococcota bacterium]
MIPTGRLVAIAFVPVLIGIAAAFVPPAVLPMLALDVLIVAVALMDLARAGGRVSATREVAPVQAVGRAFDVSLKVQNRSARPLSIRVTDDAPGPMVGLPAALTLDPSTEGEVQYELRVDTRGRQSFGGITLRWLSPLGLWERQLRLDTPEELRVYPDFAQLRQSGMNSRLAEQRVPARVRRRPGGENEFQRLRPYVPGDPYRHIDWRATARRREFTTREFGQESNQNLIFLLDTGRMASARSGDVTAFDHGLSAAVMLGQVALRHGDRVGLLAFDSTVRAWLPPKGGARSGSRLIRALYDVFPSLDEPDYAMAFRWLTAHVRRRSLVVLVTAVADEVNADLAATLVSGLARRHVVLNVWLRDREVDRLLEQPAETDDDVWNRCAAAEVVARRERSLRGLRQRGALVVDCAPSELTGTLLSRYLEVKARRLL